MQCGIKSSDLRHSQSEVTVSRGESHSCTGSSSGSNSYTRMHVVKCSTTRTSDKLKAKITLDSRVNNDSTSIDSNLNDSGTFLPPIL